MRCAQGFDREFPLRSGRFSAFRKDEGQVTIFVVLVVSLFLLGFVGFGVDMTNLFLHRQMAQGAADAACVAAGMDMLKERVNGRCTDANGVTYPCGNFTVGTSFNCVSTPTAAPCIYAAKNGYNGASGTIPLPAGVEANSVQVTFPTFVPGAVTPEVAIAGPNPFVQVDVYDSVKVYFSSLLSGTRTQAVHALAKCGLQVYKQPVPILVLDPSEPKSFQIGGNPTIAIVGGPNKSVQVDSDDSVQAAYIGGTGKVDLTKAGLKYNGADFGVRGGPGTAPGGFLTNPPFGWRSPTAPVDDPFSTVLPPPDPNTTTGLMTTAILGQDGCPTVVCTEYHPGDYVNGINVQNQTAIFAPGVYYIKGGKLEFHANSLARPTSTSGSNGTIFYLTCANPGNCTSGNVASVYIGANAGGNVALPFDTSLMHCPGDTPPGWDVRAGIPPMVSGNVLMAPCTTLGTYPGAVVPNAGIDTVGSQRGLLFFADRSAGVTETMNGGGGLLLTGTMYFRDCPNLLTTGLCSKPPTDYQTVTYLTGGSGSGTRVFGEIVTDQLQLQGNSGITMDLNPWTRPILKVALMQ